MSEFTLEAKGPFDFARSIEVMAHWEPVKRFHPGVQISFNLDGDFTPVTVTLRAEKQRLHGRVRGSQATDRVARQVARIFSLDHDAADYPSIGERDPKIGKLIDGAGGPAGGPARR